MTGIIKVNKLTESGLFISELNYDNHYKSKSNPRGNFVMIIEPLNEWNNEGVIYYQEIEGGYLVEGVAYIIEDRVDRIRKRIQEWEKEYKKKPFDYVKSDFLNERV